MKVAQFLPLRLAFRLPMNLRTHRKILVVDGRVAFVGGIGVDDQWSGNAQDEAHWRDFLA